MRAINQKAQKIMDIITDGVDEGNRHTKIDNNEPDSERMPVVVEWVGDCKLGEAYSVAHYYTQNGDLMADPEMIFLKAADGKYYPLSYKLDSMGIYREGVTWSFGEPTHINMREQKDEAVFAGTWMESIKFLQGLGGKNVN
jgi:hypothetical protein